MLPTSIAPSSAISVVEGKNHTDICLNVGSSPTEEGDQPSRQLLARVYLPAEHIDSAAMKQIQTMSQHPACQKVRVMPDAHCGAACTIGFTCEITNFATPQLIGGDIGCGISTHPIPDRMIERRNGLTRLLNIIHDSIPMGGSSNGVHKSPIIRLEQYTPFLNEATKTWRDFCKAYLAKFGVNLDQYVSSRYSNFLPEDVHTSNESVEPGIPRKNQTIFSYSLSWLQKRASEWGIGMNEITCSMGTLGSGNHYVEINERTDVLDEHSNSTAATAESSSASSSASNNNKSHENKNSKNNNNVKTKTNSNSNINSDLLLQNIVNSENYCGSINKKMKSQQEEQEQEQKEEEHYYEDEDEDDNVSNQSDYATLPKYLISVHSGSRAIGQSIYRHWTKRCHQMKNAKSAFSNNTNNNAAASAATSSSPNTSGIFSPTATATPKKKSSKIKPGTHSSKKKKNETLLSSPSSSSLPQKTENDSEQQDQISSPELFTSPAKTDDEETVPFDSTFVLTTPEDISCYYLDMIFAQHFAQMNRRVMISTVLNSLGDRVRYSEKMIIDTTHNYIDFHDLIVRKGSIRADENRLTTIGINMKEGSWLARGKGNADWNYSAPHGCGRVISRKAAASTSTKGTGKGSNKASSSHHQEDPKVKQFKSEMGDVVSATVSAGTFDERPSVYRNSNLVRSLLEPAAEIICRYKTVLNAKGSERGLGIL